MSVSPFTIDDCAFYCVSYNSPERAATMTARFAALDISLNIHTGVQMDDPRLRYTNDAGTKRLWSCCYGHLDNLANFLKSGKKFGFTCEDDVHIHKDLATYLPTILHDFDKMDLDIMLLGYMTSFAIKDWMVGYHFISPYNPDRYFQYHTYPQQQWGIHLALISRNYAQHVLDTFAYGYAVRTLYDSSIPPFNPDWTITKNTHKRALIYPMLAVEDGKGNYSEYSQGEYHRRSHDHNYNPEFFL